MEQKIVTSVSATIIILMAACITILAVFPRFHELSLALQEQSGKDGSYSVLSMLRDDSQLLQLTEDYMEAQKHQLRLELPNTVSFDDIKITGNCMTREISLSIPGIGNTYFYDYPMIGTSDGINDLRYDVEDYVGTINIITNHVCECVATMEQKYLYLDFKRPKQVYDYVVAIDAGHGGRAPGANQGEVLEKNINLAIVQQLEKIFKKDKHNIGVYYTRLDDSNPGFEERVGLANDIKADAFVSVHINSTDSGRMSGIHGTSVLYLVADNSGGSKALAESCLNNLLSDLGSASKGLVAGDEIYIIRNSKVPVALCEIGFITNPQEQMLLCSESYQRKAARGIYKGILENLGIRDQVKANE